MENQLINITNQDGELLVSARDLHKGLNISERFSSWFNRMLQYGFDENVDYVGCKKVYAANQYGGEKELDDYALKLDMAKEICMLQRNDLGKQFRRYFIECEKQLMAHALPVPQGPSLIGQDPCNNYLIRKNIKQLDTVDIPRYINQILEQAKDYKPTKRLNTYELTRAALESLLSSLVESYDVAMVRASLDKLNKLIESQKMYINRTRLAVQTKQIKKLQDKIQYYQLDNYDGYQTVNQHSYTINTAYRAVNNQIKTSYSYHDWQERMKITLQSLPTLSELNVDPNIPMKIDIYYYLKDESFDIDNQIKSFIDALAEHYRNECPEFDDVMIVDIRARKFLTYSGSFEDGLIYFALKNLSEEEIETLSATEEI